MKDEEYDEDLDEDNLEEDPEEMLDEDEISPAEEGFMKGYNDFDEEEDESDAIDEKFE